MTHARTPAQRFWPKVDKSGDCWIWRGALSDRGYGSFNVGGGRYAGAHRVAYELTTGPIPQGLQLDHLCRNRACVNPDHLEPVTQAENIRRGDGGLNNAVKTHCPRGHEYTPENTYSVRGRTGWIGRRCKECHMEGKRRRKAQQETTHTREGESE